MGLAELCLHGFYFFGGIFGVSGIFGNFGILDDSR